MRMALLILAAMPFALSACAHKGKLKTPSQIAVEAEKKKRADEKERRRAEEETPDNSDAAPAGAGK